MIIDDQRMNKKKIEQKSSKINVQRWTRNEFLFSLRDATWKVAVSGKRAGLGYSQTVHHYPRDSFCSIKEVHLDARGQSIFRLAPRRNCRFTVLHRILERKKGKHFLCSFLCCTDFYIICILFLFSSYTMYLPPHRLLEVGKILVDKKDFDNAIAWFKRAESILCNENGEAARLHLIMVRIQLIRVLEKVKNI